MTVKNQVYNAIAASSRHGITRRELIEDQGFWSSTLHPRVLELIKEGRVVEGEARTTAISGTRKSSSKVLRVA